jgi:nucleoid-associated protein YgaU
MKKRYLFVLLILFFYINILNGQSVSLKDNEFYKKGLELFNQAKIEFDKGEYDKGYELSEQAKEFFKKANEANMINSLKLQAGKNKEEAKIYIDKAFKSGADKNKDASIYYVKANDLFNQADAEYKKGEEGTGYDDRIAAYKKAVDLYLESSNHAKQALAILSPDKDKDKDYKYAKDLLDQGFTKRNLLIDTKVIDKDGSDDSDVMKILNNSQNELNNKNYKTSIEESQKALALMDDILAKKGDKSKLAALKDEADKMLQKARKVLSDAKESADRTKYEEKLKEADTALEDASNFYNNEKYRESIEKSKLVLNIISGLDKDNVFPKYYKVRLIPGKRDCFWRISGYPFIYNNIWKWKIIYEANKDKLRNPNNPHLIFPDVIFEIPSLNGEKRDGTYDPDKSYTPFDSKKDYGK